MADRFPAEIRIGGQLSQTLRLYIDDKDDDTTVLQGLIGALYDDGASHEYGGTAICNENDMNKCLNESGVLVLKCNEARDGEFENTESFCINNNIPFDRWSDHYWEWEAENVYWRPGMKIPITTSSDSSGNEIVCGATVRMALQRLKKTQHTLNTRVESSIKIIESVCPQLPSPLKCFRILD